MGEKEDLIERVISDLDLSLDVLPPKDHTVLSLWVSLDYKKKFDELQERTDKEFGKKAKEVLCHLIDKAWEKL